MLHAPENHPQIAQIYAEKIICGNLRLSADYSFDLQVLPSANMAVDGGRVTQGAERQNRVIPG
jgi:hypothetical protein